MKLGKYIGFLLCLIIGGCSKTEQPPLSVIFETDMGNDIDDAVALDMLYKYMDDGKIHLLAECVNKNSPYSTEFIHLTNYWYGYPDIPIGRVENGIDSNHDSQNYAEVVSLMKDEQEQLIFQRPSFSNDSLPEAVSLYRKVLSSQPDTSVVLVSVGFSTNLVKLLHSDPDEYSSLNGKELIRQKVKLLSMMAGSFGPYPLSEYNVVKDIPAAQAIANEWPTRIVYTPFEIGEQVKYQASTIEQDLKWASHHPLVQAYKSYLPMPYDREMWDAVATLYAIEPSDAYFTLSPWGDVHVDDEGITTFTPRVGGTRAYVTMTDVQAAAAHYRIWQLTTRPAKR